jgi:hypothetical protein
LAHGGGNAFRRSIFAAVLLAGAALAVPVVAQQSTRCAIIGRVHDPSNTPLAGVSVEAVSDVAGDSSHVVSTDADGSFRLTDLPSGHYVMTATLPEFQTFKREGISLAPGMNAAMTVVLKPSPIRD